MAAQSRALLEIETKFDVGPDAVVPDLSHLPRIATVDAPVDEDLAATYFDTADLDLLAAHITLRRRTGGHDAGWHLKIPTGEDRYELQEPLGDSSQVPERIVAIVSGLTRDRALQEVATLHTRRSVTRLRDQRGDVLAEFCDDIVDATLGPTRPRTSSHWHEWELELSRSDPALAAAGARCLISAGATQSSAPSKLSRVLTLVAAPNRTEANLEPHSLTYDVLGAYIRTQSARLRRLDPLVRADLPDAVHQMRVVARRLRAVLLGYDREFEPGRTARIRKDLGWLADVLGRARDLEALRERIQTTAAAEAPALQPIDDRLADSHLQAHLDAVAAMASARYFGLVDALDAFVSTPPWSSRAQQPAAAELRKRLHQQWRQLDRAVKDVRRTRGTERAGRLHEARRIAKRLRYCTEAAEPILGARADELADELSDLQDALGRHHDATLAQEVIRTMSDTETSASAHLVRQRLAKEADHDDECAINVVREIRHAHRFHWLR